MVCMKCTWRTVGSQGGFSAVVFHAYVLTGPQRRRVKRVPLRQGHRPDHCLQAKKLATLMMTSEKSRAARAKAEDVPIDHRIVPGQRARKLQAEALRPVFHTYRWLERLQVQTGGDAH